MSEAAKKLEPTNPLFDKRLLQAFVEGVLKTLSTIAQTEATVGKPFIEPEMTEQGEIAGMVGMVAPPLKGTLLLSFSKDSILKIVENMLGEKYPDLNTEVSDAVGELTNMVYGSAKTALNQTGYNFEMAIPTVIRGKFIITKAEKAATLVIPFHIDENLMFHVKITVQM